MTLQDLIHEIVSNIKANNKLKDMECLLENYNENDWKQYIKFIDPKYTRNVVYRDDLIEVILICWNSEAKSEIHDHPDKGCLFKILQGNLTEVVYDKDNNDFVIKEAKNLSSNKISYQEGKNGLHQIINGNEKTISLHIYSPPNYKPCFYRSTQHNIIYHL